MRPYVHPLNVADFKGIRGQANIAIFCDGQNVVLEVRDQGRGLPVVDDRQTSHGVGVSDKGGLFESLGVEASERIVLYAVTNLYRVAAHFTVLDVALTANRQVENHRNLFPAIRATEGVFHRDSML
jgi:hypothetical protein